MIRQPHVRVETRTRTVYVCVETGVEVDNLDSAYGHLAAWKQAMKYGAGIPGKPDRDRYGRVVGGPVHTRLKRFLKFIDNRKADHG